MEWLAGLYNSPDDRLGQMLLIYGPEGTGKTTLATLARILVGDRHACVVPNPGAILDGFNGHADGRRLIHIEEAYDSGRQHAHANALKAMIDGETMLINAKNVAQVQRHNIAAFIACTNYETAVELDGAARRVFAVETGRRWQVVDDSPKYDAARQYWNGVYERFICDDFAQIFATWALTQPRRPFGWLQKHAPTTTIKAEIKAATAAPIDRFIDWARELIAAYDADPIGAPLPLAFGVLAEPKLTAQQLHTAFSSWFTGVEHGDARFIPTATKFGLSAKKRIRCTKTRTANVYDLRAPVE